MPRTKGSKNKPKTMTADFATQIAEKQSAKEALAAEIASITANIDTLKADLKEKKTDLICQLQNLMMGKTTYYLTFFNLLRSLTLTGQRNNLRVIFLSVCIRFKMTTAGVTG